MFLLQVLQCKTIVLSLLKYKFKKNCMVDKTQLLQKQQLCIDKFINS